MLFSFFISTITLPHRRRAVSILTAAQQQLAIEKPYNVAAGQSATVIPTELAGQTLTPGVYTSAPGTFGMTGTLTLNGGGDPDAVARTVQPRGIGNGE